MKFIGKTNWLIILIFLDILTTLFYRNGEYEIHKNQLANELREVKTQWRNEYYNKINAQKALINKHATTVDLSKKCRKMYELISHYKGLNDKQRQELKMNNDDNVIDSEKIERMKEDGEKANEKRHQEEK